MEQMQEEIDYWKNRCLETEESTKKEVMKYKNMCLEVEKRVEDIEENSKNEASNENPVPTTSLNNVIVELKKEICMVKKGFQSISEKFQESDQYSRKNSLIIKGYKYLPNMNNWDFVQATANELNYLFPSLNGPIHPIHIDDAHPLNKHTVIVKFSNRWVKTEVLKCKRDLEGSGLTVTEHLTPHTLELVKSAGKIVGPNNIWVYNTLVFARYENTRYSIRNAQDLDALTKAAKSKSDMGTLPQSQINLRNTNSSQENICADTESPVTTPLPSPTQPNDTYYYNYPALYNSLFYCNANYTKTSTIRGRPSRNGRGRHSSRDNYNVINRNY